MGREKAVVVCSANICRSPLAAYRLSSHGPSEAASVIWVSAGLDAVAGQPMCNFVIGDLSVDEAGAAYCEAHRSRPLDDDDLDEAALVLTATKAQRGEIALRRPSARARTFTLLEAAALAELAAASGGGSPHGLDEVAALLNGHRGLGARSTDAGRGFALFRRPTIDDSFDVPDVHADGRRHHSAMMKRVDVGVRSFWSSLEKLGARVG